MISSFKGAFGYPISAILAIPYLVLLGLPLLLGAFALCYRSSAFNRETLPYWAVGVAIWLSEFHRKDLTHLIYGSPVLIILLFHLYYRLQIPFAGVVRSFVVGCCVFLASFNFLWAQTAQRKLITPRGTMNTFNSNYHAAAIDFVNEHLKPADELFVYPYAPMYYFLTGRDNPTRYSVLLYHMHTDTQFHDAVSSLESRRIRYIIWDSTFEGLARSILPHYRVPDRDQQIIEPYVHDKYHVLKILNGVQILERNDDAK